MTTRIWFLGRTHTPRTRHQWLYCSWSRGHCLWSPACQVVPEHPGLVTSDYGVHELGVTVCGVQQVLWDFNKKLLLRCSSRSVIFLTMKILREHRTLPHSFAACHQLTFRYAYEGSRSPHASALHWNPPGFCKKKVKYFSNRPRSFQMSRSDIHENCITQNCRKLLEEEFIIQFVDINKIEDSRVLDRKSVV